MGGWRRSEPREHDRGRAGTVAVRSAISRGPWRPADQEDRPMVATVPVRSFVPRELDVADWSQLEPLYRELLAREVNSAGELEKWLGGFWELTSVVDEYGSRRYIDKSCHTDDEGIKRRYLQFVEEIEPKVKPLFFELQKKFLASPHLSGLTDRKYEVLVKRWRADVEIFREQNVPLETEAT